MARFLNSFNKPNAAAQDSDVSPFPDSPIRLPSKENSKRTPSDYGFYTLEPKEFNRFKISKDLVPDLKKLVERFFPKRQWKEISESKQQSGSFNQIQKFETKDNKIKRALRISKKPCFVEWPSGEIVDYDSFLNNPIQIPSMRPKTTATGVQAADELREIREQNQQYKDYMIQQYEQSLYNWANASERDICPRIQYWGFIKQQSYYRNYNTYVTFIYQCIISDLYPMDLNEYMIGFFQSNSTRSQVGQLGVTVSREAENKLSDREVKIQKTLTFLLDKLAMFPFYMICFDIKPQNCVINPALLESQDENIWTQSIKLIDLDADYCNPFNFLKSKELNGHMRKMTSTLQNMMMANYFYTFYQRNIFANYFKNEICDRDDSRFEKGKEYMKENKPSLEVLFCKKYNDTDILYANGQRQGGPMGRGRFDSRFGPIKVATNEEGEGNSNTLFRETRKKVAATAAKITETRGFATGLVNTKRYLPTIIPSDEASIASLRYQRMISHYLFPKRRISDDQPLPCKELFKILYERCFILTPEKGKDVYNLKTRGGKKQKKTISKRKNINNKKRKSKKLRKSKKFRKLKKFRKSKKLRKLKKFKKSKKKTKFFNYKKI